MAKKKCIWLVCIALVWSVLFPAVYSLIPAPAALSRRTEACADSADPTESVADEDMFPPIETDAEGRPVIQTGMNLFELGERIVSAGGRAFDLSGWVVLRNIVDAYIFGDYIILCFGVGYDVDAYVIYQNGHAVIFDGTEPVNAEKLEAYGTPSDPPFPAFIGYDGLDTYGNGILYFGEEPEVILYENADNMLTQCLLFAAAPEEAE